MQEMCSEVMRINPAVFFLIPDHFKTQKTCIKVVEVQPWKLYYVPNHFMTQKMCNAAVSNDLSSLEYVSDWFVSQGLVKIWHDDNDYCKNECVLLGIHQGGGIGLFLKTRKNRQKNCVNNR